jgi:Cytochrome P450
MTTSSSLSLALWELAKDVDLQRRIREEIIETMDRARENGEAEIGFDDYNNMTLFRAFIKVSSHCHLVWLIVDLHVVE